MTSLRAPTVSLTAVPGGPVAPTAAFWAGRGGVSQNGPTIPHCGEGRAERTWNVAAASGEPHHPTG